MEAHPFVPRGQEQLRERCEEIFHTQVAGLAKRLEHIGKPPVPSASPAASTRRWPCWSPARRWTLLGVPRDRIRALTMPGFGTSGRTRANARALMQQLGVSVARDRHSRASAWRR